MALKRTRSVKARMVSAVLLLWIVLQVGCASTRLRSFADPDFEGKTYHRILVASRIAHLDQAADAEDMFLKRFKDIDAECVRSSDVLYPTREFNDDELFAALSRNKIDAMLVVRVTDYYEDVQTHTSSTGHLNANTYYYGPYASSYGHSYGSSTTYTTRKPRIRHQVELYDVEARRMAWVGGSFTRGNAYAGSKDLMSSLARETKKALLEHGFITKAQ